MAGGRFFGSSAAPWVLLLAAVLAVALAWRASFAKRPATTPLGWLFATAICGAARIAIALGPANPGHAIAAVSAHVGRKDAAEVVARVVSCARDERGALLALDADGVDGRAVAGGVRLRVMDGVPPVLPGDLVAFRARLLPPRAYRNPGVPDTTVADRARGLQAVAAVARAAAIRVLAAGPAGIRRAAESWRRTLARRLDASTRGDARALLGALVLGERALVSEGVETVFRRSGLTHLLSVSGVHMAAIALLAFYGLRRALARLPWLPLAVPIRVVAAAIALPCCAGYALLAGAAVPVVRSAVIAAVMFSGICVRRNPDAGNALALAALLLLTIDPGALFTPSFQLSFGACVGLLLAPRVKGAGLARAVARLAMSTTAATMLTSAVCAFHFGEVAVAGLVANLIAIPYSTFVLLPAALLSLLAPWMMPAAAVLADMLIEMARLGAALPGASLRVPAPTAAEVALCTAAAMLALRCRWRLAIGIVAVLVIAIPVRLHTLRVRHGARVTVMDVGQGDAILVELPGWTLLCDGGGTFDGSPAVGERAVLPALRALGIGRLDAVVLTHPHPDHFGGLRAVVRELEVAELWTNGEPCRHPACADLLALAADQGTRVTRPRTVVRGGARIEPLYPLPAYDPAMSTNDNSVALRVTALGRSVLLTGDLEGEGEILMAAATGHAARADVLKVPHHGSRTSSTDELLDAVRPHLAVVSAGAANRFGFPHSEVLDRYARRGIRVLRTDRHGAVTLRLGATLQVATVDSVQSP